MNYTILLGSMNQNHSDHRPNNKLQLRDRSQSLPAALQFNQEIAHFSKQKQYDLAQQSFERMLQKNIRPDVVTYNTMINVYVKCQRLGDAFRLFEQMKSEQIEPSIITYTSLIDGCGKCNNFRRALALYTSVKRLSIALNMHFFNAILNASFLNGNLQNVDMILQDIKSSGLRPNTVTYNTLLQGYVRLGLLFRMKPTINEMIALNVEFNPITQAAILQSIQLIKDQESLLEFMDLLSITKFIPTKVQATQAILDLVSSRRLLLAQQLLGYLAKMTSQIAKEAFIGILYLAGELSNFQIIKWTLDLSQTHGFNLTYHGFVAQLCAFASFNNYKQASTLFDQFMLRNSPANMTAPQQFGSKAPFRNQNNGVLNHMDEMNTLTIKAIVFIKLLQCFLLNNDIERADRIINEIFTLIDPLTEKETDQIVSLFFEKSLFDRVVKLFEMIRDRNYPFGIQACNCIIRSGMRINQMNIILPSLLDFHLSIQVVIEMAKGLNLEILPSIPWSAIVDKITNAPSSSLIEALMVAFNSRDLKPQAWHAFKSFVGLKAEINENLTMLAYQILMNTSYKSSPGNALQISNSEDDYVFLLNTMKENHIVISPQLYSTTIRESILNGDLSTGMSLKIEMDQLKIELDDETQQLFEETYGSIQHVLPETTPKIPQKKSRRRSSTYSTGPVNSLADEMQQLSTRSVMIALDLDYI